VRDNVWLPILQNRFKHHSMHITGLGPFRDGPIPKANFNLESAALRRVGSNGSSITAGAIPQAYELFEMERIMKLSIDSESIGFDSVPLQPVP